MNPTSTDGFSDVDSDGNDGFDLQQEIARSAFADMCHDWERNQKYDRALQLTIERLHAVGQEAHVLDIGTGSGLLSMMAVRAGADSVTACEAFRPMADCAERVIGDNEGMAEKIRLIKKKSTELVVGPGRDMERKANVLVTELFDTELIGEGAIATYRHALKYLLEPGCRVIPDSTTVWAQLVECPLAMSWQTSRIVSNSDGDVLLRPPEDIVACRGSSAVFDVQLSQLPVESFNVLSEPVAVFGFDWSGKQELNFKRHSRKVVRTVGSGVPHAVFMWWDLKMDAEGTVMLSCAPYWAHPDQKELKKNNKNPLLPEQNLIPWRDHWMQAIYFLPYTKSMLMMGQEITLDAYHDEFSLWFGLDNDRLEPPHCSCGLHIACSRSRIGQLNEGLRNKRILNYLEDVLSKDSVVLVLGEGSLLGLAIAAMGAKKIIQLETGTISRKCMENYVHFNVLKNVQILTSTEELTSEVCSEITHIFGEPYFGSAILPWENAIKFGTLLDQIKPLLKPEVAVIPSSFSVHAVPVEFLDLHKINAPLGKCEGFDLSLMDRMIEEHSTLTDTPVEAQPLWEYPCFALGPQSKLITIDLATGSMQPQAAQGELITVLSHAVAECNGVALWANWHLDSNSTSPKSTVSTGPTVPIEDVPMPQCGPIKWNANWRQGVHLLRKRSAERKSIPWRVKFNAQLQALYFQFDC